MKHSHFKLPNGLQVLSINMPGVESVTTTLWVKTGSRNETTKNNGISHFLEHMAFKGSKRYPTARDVLTAVDSLGAVDNAATSKEWTNFWIKASADKLTESFDILSDMFLYPKLLDSEIEKEKGVVTEEIALKEDTPMSKLGDLFENLIFKGSTLERDILGTKATVNSFNRNDFVTYRERYYYPENTLICVAGGVNAKEVFALAKRYFADIKASGKKSVKPKSRFKQTSPRLLLNYKKTDQGHFVLGFRGSPRGHKDRYAEALLSSILGGLSSSRLFMEVREERGLAYMVGSSGSHYMDTGYFYAYAGVALKKIEEAISAVLNEHYSISNGKKPITGTELKRAKDNMKGRMALSLEDTKSVNSFFALEQLFEGKVRTPDEVFEKIEKVTKGQVHAVAKKLFKPENLNLAIIGPYKNKATFAKLLK